MAVTTRRATARDVSRVFEIGYDYAYNDALVKFMPVNEERAMHYLTTLTHMGFVIVAEKDDEIVGALVLQPAQQWFSDTWYLTDLFFYVLPEWRTTSAADALIRSAKKIAEDNGAMIQMSVINGQDLSRKAEYYKRRGFVYVGGIFVNVEYAKTDGQGGQQSAIRSDEHDEH